MKVYLNDPIAPSAVERLKRHVEIVDNYDHPEELDAVILRQQYCTGDVIRMMTKCKIIQQHGVGLDRIDVDAAREAGIPVRNTPGTNARAVAEYTVALMMDVSRKVTWIDKKTRAGELPSFGMPETVGRELYGRKLGLVGSGHVAREVARICKGGFDMEVLCWNPHRTSEEIRALGMEPVSELKELFRICDYVSLHCLLTEETRNLVDAEVLSQASPKLMLVNTARGGLIDEQALYEALVSGRIAAAGLDVFANQPPATDDPLLSLDNVVCAMHVAGSTNEALERTGRALVDSVFEALGIKEC